jgi:hypothetical protein
MNSVRLLEGILSYLSRKYGGNVHDTGIVTITSSSTNGDDPQYSDKNLGDPNSARVFYSNGTVGQWVHWDFIELRVIPTHYSIQTHSNTPHYSHLKLWAIKGSIDCSNWAELYRRTNSHDLNVVSFDSDKRERITQTTAYWHFIISNYLDVSVNIEINKPLAPKC